MTRRKNNKKNIYMDALNEIDDMKNSKRRELLNLNFSIRAKFKNKKQKELSNIIKNNRITFVTGTAGSGKTFIALKTALEIIKDENINIENIILTTPIVEVGDSSIGYLPGDLEDKVSLYFEHFYDNMKKIVGEETTKFLRVSNIVENKIINFVRGATFGNYDENGNPIGSICILDECQNLTIHQLKTYISRLGENSKMVILGDIEQIDIKLKNNEKCGLEDAINRFKEFDGIGIVTFDEEDIVRDKFLIDIMKKYKK